MEPTQKALLKAIEQQILENAQNPNVSSFEGLTQDEISLWNRTMMFGENDEAFPDAWEWSLWTD